MLSVDCNELAAQHFRHNSAGLVLKMDINRPDAACELHKVCPPGLHTVVLGFPCQPYSQQGRKMGLQDPRSQTMWSGLHIAFMLQCQSLLLECVAAAGQHPAIQKAIREIAGAMNWTVLQTNLDQSHQWPNRRYQWWAILMPSKWCSAGIRPWPKFTDFPTVGSIMRPFACWSTAEEQQLKLDPQELAMYNNPNFGQDQRLLSTEHIAPAILHSYANATRDCPCKCRLQGFSHYSLNTKGLRGFYVTTDEADAPRFLHHREAALLLGIPDDVLYCHPPRDNLCLLGLVASPMQMVWIYSIWLENCAYYDPYLPKVKPEIALRMYQQHLLKLWHVNEPDRALSTTRIQVHTQEEPSINVCIDCPTPAGQLVAAERINQEWGVPHSLLQDDHTPCHHYANLGSLQGLQFLHARKNRDANHQPDQLPCASCTTDMSSSDSLHQAVLSLRRTRSSPSHLPTSSLMRRATFMEATRAFGKTQQSSLLQRTYSAFHAHLLVLEMVII